MSVFGGMRTFRFWGVKPLLPPWVHNRVLSELPIAII